MARRVVVTGLGAITPLGQTAQKTWESAKNGVCGIDKITIFDTSGHKAKLAGEVKNFDPTMFLDKKQAMRMDRFTQFALIAAKEAMIDSKLQIDEQNAGKCGIIVSSGIGGLGTIEQEHTKGLEKGFDRVTPFFIPMVISNMAAGTIAIDLGLKGSCTCVVTACAGGSDAIGQGFRNIRDGYHDVMFCGGAEASITPLGIGAFTSMKALNETDEITRASIPFDKERNGFVMGEGAGILVLEEYEHAKKRNAKIYGEVIGYGSTCDAYHITAPDPDGLGAAGCMNQAIEDAGIDRKEIGYINAHGTSTPINDRCETLAIKRVFKDAAKELVISSTKSMTGHLLGASGAVEALFCLMALEEQWIPPTINYQVPDEECDLDIVPNQGRSQKFTYAMSNSLGFGGHNASLIFKKGEV